MDLKPKPVSRRRRYRRILIPAAAFCALGVLLVAGLNAYVLIRGNATTWSDAESATPAETAIVLGAYVEPDGKMSRMLADRVEQAANLWKAGKVRKILVSGDHGAWRYDEPTTMKNALVREGIPERVIFSQREGPGPAILVEKPATSNDSQFSFIDAQKKLATSKPSPATKKAAFGS